MDTFLRNRRRRSIPATLLLLSHIVLVQIVMVQVVFAQSGFLRKGIDEVQAENYEEAIPLLEKARKENPESSLAAFFLGMAYKGAARFTDALPHLRDAVALTPRIKEGIVELIDLLLILSSPERLGEAEKWIGVAENETIFPAKVAFLKGQLLKMQKDLDGAVQAFQRAKTLDPGLTQTADYQIALCRLRSGEFREAKNAFLRVINQNPGSDLAGFARKYKEMADDRLFAERPLRITLTLLGQYDTNMVLRPTDDLAATGITDEEGFTTTDILSLEYLPDIEGPLTFYGQYAALANLHQYVGDTHDIIGNTLALQPGYAWKDWSAGLKGQYTHYLRRNPSYAAYMDQFTAGPVIRGIPFKDHFVEVQAGCLRRHFFDAPTIPEEDRDADGFSGSLSWIWQAHKKAIFNFGYQYARENTDGANWENTGHRFLLASHISLTDNLKLQLGVEEFIQEYDNVHSIFGKAREDHVNVASAGITYDVNRHLSILLHHARTRSNSNLAVYDYTRNLTSLGVELRY